MANITQEDTTTTGDVFIPIIWSDLVIKFREKNLAAAKFFERRDSDVLNFGDTIYFPTTTQYTVTSFTEGNKLEDKLEANTEGKVTLTVDQYKVRPFLVSDMLSRQSKYDKKALDMAAAGYAVAKAIDSAILADCSNYTNSTGTAGTSITNLTLTEAQCMLDELDVPESERCWFFHPRKLKDLMDLTGNYFTSLDFAQGDTLIQGQINKMLLGSPVIKTTNVPVISAGSPASSSTWKGIYAHKQATGIAMQWAPEIQSEKSVNFQGELCNVRALYGIKTLRPDHGVTILS